MTRVFLANPLTEERSAFRILILDLRMELVGEASDWVTLSTQAGPARPDMILFSWALLPQDRQKAIERLRKECPDARIVAIVSQAGDHQSEGQLAGVDAFISKEDFPLKVAEILKMPMKDKELL